MKLFFFICAAFLGTCNAQNALSLDMVEFLEMIPVEEGNEIVYKYLENEEFLGVVLYLIYDEDFKTMLIEVESLKEFVAMMAYLEDSGLEVYYLFNQLHDIIGIPPLTKPKTLRKINGETARGAVGDCRNEIRGILLKDEIAQLHEYKLINSPAFKTFSDRLETQEIKDLIDDLYANKIATNLLQVLLDHGLDFVDTIFFYMEITGFREISV